MFGNDAQAPCRWLRKSCEADEGECPLCKLQGQSCPRDDGLLRPRLSGRRCSDKSNGVKLALGAV